MASNREERIYVMTRDRAVHRRQPIRVVIVESIIYNGADMLNGLLHSNDYEERRMTRCIAVLPNTPHSALDTSAVVKPCKGKLQKSPFTL
ncbi:hypothetical protein TNCV_1605941 [Trichonephila clavipes]|nr:hypothetical protein TNCV_1605941 [Trichonephila clavipes]